MTVDQIHSSQVDSTKSIIRIPEEYSLDNWLHFIWLKCCWKHIQQIINSGLTCRGHIPIVCPSVCLLHQAVHAFLGTLLWMITSVTTREIGYLIAITWLQSCCSGSKLNKAQIKKMNDKIWGEKQLSPLVNLLTSYTQFVIPGIKNNGDDLCCLHYCSYVVAGFGFSPCFMYKT